MRLRLLAIFFHITVAAAHTTISSNEQKLDYCTKERFKENPTKKDKNYYKQDIGVYVKNFIGIVEPEVEPYVTIQLKLETIAEKHGLYHEHNQTNEILKKLHEDSKVKKLLQKCKKFHTAPKCNDSKYRSIDGMCNNLKHPHWGSAHTASDRFVPPSYDGIRELRKAASGKELPNARKISAEFKDKTIESSQVSAFFTYYGQIIVHDISLGPATSKNGKMVPCCQKPNPNCRNIEVSPDDPFYKPFIAHLSFVKCMPLARTAPYPKCNFEKREQINKKTAFIDVSVIYGSDEQEALQMRANDSSGRLNSRQTKAGDILPQVYSNKTLFCPVYEPDKCFLSGDERVNQHTMLTCIQTLLVRFHNFIHDKLHKLNPHWDNEKLYQESRRIVIAIQQNMVYKEYLPFLVGPDYMKKYNLSVHTGESLYNDEIRPIILNDFNTASFRLHSMVPKAVSTTYPKIRMDLTYAFFCPVYEGQLDDYIMGSCEARSERFDRYMKKDVTNFLHRPPKATFGVDLAAINIQRGRDHGLAPYVDVVSKCLGGKTKIKSFSDLNIVMSDDGINFLKKIYSDVRDIDQWVGMTVETPLKGGVVGATATCVSAVQFYRLKFGDSFFYTHKNGRYPFTKGQLKAIRSYSMARWLCDTTSYHKVRRYPLAAPDENNPLTSCQTLKPLDLSAWKEV